MRAFKRDRSRQSRWFFCRAAAIGKKTPSKHNTRIVLIAVLIPLWAILTANVLWPVISELNKSPSKLKLPKPDGTNYLVIAPQALGKSASAWADYRRGTGHAHPFSSHADTYLPAAYFSVDPNEFSGYGTDPIPSDDGYTSDSSGGIPSNALPILIDRIPARTEEEAFLLLERTRNYEETPPTGGGRARIELILSNAGFDPQYDPVFEWALKTLIQKDLPDEFGWHMFYFIYGWHPM